MKNYLILLLVCMNYILLSQDNVGIGTVNPDNSALLEMQSTEKGFLLPRMTTDQRNLIDMPAIGLMIFNLDSNCLEFWNGTFWMEHCGEIASGNKIPDAIYVSVSGNDITGDGSPSHPYRTIQKGIVEAGVQIKDTVVISTGFYNETSITLLNKFNLVVLGSYNPMTWQKEMAPQQRTFFVASGPDIFNSGFTLDMSSNVELDGLDIFGPNGNASFMTSYGMMISNSNGIVISDCNIQAGYGTNGNDGIDGSDGIDAITNGAQGGGEFPASGGNPGVALGVLLQLLMEVMEEVLPVVLEGSGVWEAAMARMVRMVHPVQMELMD